MSHELRFTKLPLYCQVADLIAERIANGHWTRGAALPNEQDLARELHVSNGTVRRALDRLEDFCLLTRKQGRGTFVVDQTSRDFAMRFEKLRDERGNPIGQQGKVLAQGHGTANGHEQALLQLEPGARVLRTMRLITCSERPFIYEQATLALARFPGLGDDMVEDNDEPWDYSLPALAQRHGIHLARASESASVWHAEGDAAERLGVEPGKSLLRLDQVIYALNDTPIKLRIRFCNLRKEFYLSEMRG